MRTIAHGCDLKSFGFQVVADADRQMLFVFDNQNVSLIRHDVALGKGVLGSVGKAEATIWLVSIKRVSHVNDERLRGRSTFVIADGRCLLVRFGNTFDVFH